MIPSPSGTVEVCRRNKVMTLLDYLTEAAHSGASDLFLVTGAPVSVKVEGVLRPLEEERIVPSRGEALVKELYTLAQRSSTTFM